MIAFDTPIPISWIVIGAIVAAAVLAWVSLRLHGLLRPSYLWSLAVLRFWALCAILLLLVNPYKLEERPDSNGFRVAVLVDASGSMDTADVDEGRTRFDVVKDYLGDADRSPITALREKDYRLNISLFAENTVPFTEGQARLLPGSTALGSILQEESRDRGSRDGELGAVLLVSDGQSNTGTSPIEAARQYRARGIPVSTIGIGSPAQPGTVRAAFSSPRFQGEKGEPMNLRVDVANTRDRAQNMILELHNEEGLLDSREITLPANSENQEDFTVTPFQAGGQAFRLVAKPENEPEQVDVAAVQVDEPDEFRVLYLGSRPAFEYRFLRQAVAAAEQIQLEAVIRTGPESFFHLLTSNQEEMAPRDAFPEEAAFFNDFDAIIVDGRTLGELGPAESALRDFVANRGGGLLLTGPLEDVPEDLASLLPVVTWKDELPIVRRELSVATAPIFNEIAGGTLFKRPAVFLPEDLPAFVATEWKRGARPVLRLAEEQSSLMAVQAYGAGRVGWLGTDATWRWRMASSTGIDQHRLFWNNALVWLASTGKPRTTVPLQGTRVPVAADLDAGIEVMGSDFRPAREGEVIATVVTPDGETSQMPLRPSFQRPGRFEMDFRPEQTGEHRIRYTVQLPEGEELTRETFFIASHHDEEREETAYREDVLRDIARITGGEFRHYNDARGMREIPLAEGVPTRESRRHLAGSPFFLLFLAAPLFAEWYFRRRLGLK